MTMPAGEYWIGDLCYVLKDVWDEFCVNLEEGEFTFKDGRKVAWYHTAYGDGIYEDELGNSYPVDAGLIGCILLSDVKDLPPNLGHIHSFYSPFNVYKEGSKIIFGDKVIIDTDPTHEDEWESSNEWQDSGCYNGDEWENSGCEYQEQ